MSITMIYAYSIIGIFNLPVDIIETIYVMSLMQLISFIPIQVLGGLGISEITIVYLYGVFGINHAEKKSSVL
ncbi:MAG: hypothetical protein HN392_01180 [Anaerolineae bacterium]|jgi:uncharacterized membrane protein YbhN (UPF0104 family)|nr:hypothetical protein [Anaerolineae bacterium]